MSLWSFVVANASVIALVAVLVWRARRAPVEDQRRLRTVLFGIAGLAIAVGAIAFLWTLTRPS